MKILLFVVAGLFVAVVVYKAFHLPPDRTFSIHADNMPLDKLLDSVGKDIPYFWFVTHDSVKRRFYPVTIKLDSATLFQVVDSVQAREPLLFFNLKTNNGPIGAMLEIRAKH